MGGVGGISRLSVKNNNVHFHYIQEEAITSSHDGTNRNDNCKAGGKVKEGPVVTASPDEAS